MIEIDRRYINGDKVLFLEMLLRYVSETPLKDVTTLPNTIKNLKSAGCKASDVYRTVLDVIIATGDNQIMNAVYRSNTLLQSAENTRRLLIAQVQNELAKISEKSEGLEITIIYNNILRVLEKYNKNAERKAKITIETIPLPLQGKPTLQEIKDGYDLMQK